MCFEKFSSFAARHLLQMKKKYCNLKSFKIHWFRTKHSNSNIYNDSENGVPTAINYIPLNRKFIATNSRKGTCLQLVPGLRDNDDETETDNESENIVQLQISTVIKKEGEKFSGKISEQFQSLMESIQELMELIKWKGKLVLNQIFTL